MADMLLDARAVTVRFGGLTAVDAVSLTIHPGETVALVGASGAGKTTLVNLLPRFIDPTSGTIELDGHDLREWQIDALRSQFALVSQHVVMLNDSIAMNVALGAELDRERVQRVDQIGDGEHRRERLSGTRLDGGHAGFSLSS